MKISIIIPIYNVAAYITRCLTSITSQTYKNIECILIDDCGTDDSMQIAEEFIENYNGTILFSSFHHEKNRGQSAARNTGIQKASGEYLYFIDSDDTITNDCIETLVGLAQKYPNADYIQGNTVTGFKELMPHHFRCTVPEYCDDKEKLEELVLSSTITTIWNKLIKLSFLKDNNLLFPEGIIMEDTYWSYFLAKKVKAVAFTNKGIYNYYINGISTINNSSRKMQEKRVLGFFAFTKAFYEDMKKENKASKQQRMYLASNMVIMMNRLYMLHSLRKWCHFWEMAIRMFCSACKQLTIYRLVLFILMMPPLCFLSAYKGWIWRVNQHLVAKI